MASTSTSANSDVSVGSTILGVLLDYGNTIVGIRDGATVLRGVLKELGHEIDEATASEGVRASDKRWQERYASLPRGSRWTEEIRLDCYGAALRAVGLGNDVNVLAEKVVRLWDPHENMGPYGDVKPTLRALDGMGLRLGVLSQTTMAGSDLKIELESHRLLQYLSHVLMSEDAGYDKPDPRLFQRAAGEIGLPAAQLMYVGNRYHQDVVGARNAGLTPVLLERGKRKPRDCLAVSTLGSLPSIIRS